MTPAVLLKIQMFTLYLWSFVHGDGEVVSLQSSASQPG